MTKPRPCLKFSGVIALLFVCGALVPRVPAQDSDASEPRALPSDADIARIRAELQTRQREREAAENERGPLQLEALPALPVLPSNPTPSEVNQHPERLAWLDLIDKMDTFRALVLIESADTSAALRRVPLVVKGETWIALKPGAWRIRIVAGLADGQPNFNLAPIEATLHRNSAYRLSLDSELERHLFEERHQQQSAAATPAPASAPRGGPRIHYVP